MILLEKIRVSPDRGNLEIIVSCNPTDCFKKLRISTQEDYQDILDGIKDWDDVYNYDITLSSKSNYETLYLPFDTTQYTTETGVTEVITALPKDSMYFIYLETANSITSITSESRVAVSVPLTHFYYCLVDKVLTLRTKCDTCLFDVEILYFLIEGLKNAIQLNLYTQAISFWNELSLLCDYNCSMCDPETQNQTGIGISVINDNFIVQ